jgi:hypothetical protein
MFCCNSRDDGKLDPKHIRKESRPVQIGTPWEAVQANPATDADVQMGKPVGVGIVFQPENTGALHVKSLAVGGPAEQSNLVHIGDILHEIDGHQVFRKPASQLAPLILGQEGSRVRLGFSREKFPRLIYVELRRGWSLQSVQAPDGTIPATPPKGFSHPLPEVSPAPLAVFRFCPFGSRLMAWPCCRELACPSFLARCLSKPTILSRMPLRCHPSPMTRPPRHRRRDESAPDVAVRRGGSIWRVGCAVWARVGERGASSEGSEEQALKGARSKL